MKKNIYLITNADDFGISKSVTDAIIECHENGFLTSTTLMANMSGTDYAIKMQKKYPKLGIGIHFNLTEGSPLTEHQKIPLIVNEKGEFKSNLEQRKNLIYGRTKQKQVESELTSQIEYLLDNGVELTHFDSHHHITGTPLAFNASSTVAKRFGLRKARSTNINYRFTEDYQEGLALRLKKILKTLPKSVIHKMNHIRLKKLGFKTPKTKILPSRVLPKSENHIKQFIRTLSVLKSGTTEISFHPGYKNSYADDSKYTSDLRIADFKVLTSNEVISYIKKRKLNLINFRDL